MRTGTLELLLLEGHGLKITDFFGKSDPYAIVSCKGQEQKSSTIERGGADPKWNQSFFFTIDEEVSEVTIKVFDADKFSADDAIGTATIPLANIFHEYEKPVTSYEVVRSSGNACGELKVGLKFTPEKPEEKPDHHHHHHH
eukprot:c17742_g2_i1 orf=571-993(+)